jgi:hypothetical protein
MASPILRLRLLRAVLPLGNHFLECVSACVLGQRPEARDLDDRAKVAPLTKVAWAQSDPARGAAALLVRILFVTDIRRDGRLTSEAAIRMGCCDGFEERFLSLVRAKLRTKAVAGGRSPKLYETIATTERLATKHAVDGAAVHAIRLNKMGYWPILSLRPPKTQFHCYGFPSVIWNGIHVLPLLPAPWSLSRRRMSADETRALNILR